MLLKDLRSIFLLPGVIRDVMAATSSSTACNNSPALCSQAYDQITHLGAHNSPFIRDSSTGFSSSGNHYYNTTVQLSAGVRLISGQVQRSDTNSLNMCHTSCQLLDAGPLRNWLTEVRTWMDLNPNEVVTILLVNGAGASASEIANEYAAAGITTDLAYIPSGSISSTQTWPTLQELINSGTRLVNLLTSGTDSSVAPYLIDQFTYVFENDYNNNAPTDYGCEASRPSNVANNAAFAIQNKMMPLMNHFLYQEFFGVQSPNATYAPITNAPSGGVGNLGSAATDCTSYYGQAPTYILVDFFNVGPAMATVDRLNGVTNPVGRTSVSTDSLSRSVANGLSPPAWWAICLGTVIMATRLVAAL